MNPPFSWTPLVVLAALRRLPMALLQLLPRLPQPNLERALLHQAQRLRNPQQALVLEHLSASWLGVLARRRLRQALQLRLVHLDQHPSPSRTSTSSKERTARRTGKRRR